MRHSLRQRLADLHAAGNRVRRAPDGPRSAQRLPLPSRPIGDAAHLAVSRYLGSMR